MPVNRLMKTIINGPLGALGLQVVQANGGPECSYLNDGMTLVRKNLSFMYDAKFLSAYQRGMNSGHHIGRPKGSDIDLGIQFRTYIECWAANHGMRLDGDFVCCGVNTGIIPLAICEYCDINNTDKVFWLFDTYEGIPTSQMTAAEAIRRAETMADFYSECFDLAQRNFAPFPKAKLVRGMVPDTLTSVPIDRVAYLSIDMNIVFPEIEAIKFFWPKLTPGAIVILDDYAFKDHEEQHNAMDAFAFSVGVSILTLPTGQGMIVKPCSR